MAKKKNTIVVFIPKDYDFINVYYNKELHLQDVHMYVSDGFVMSKVENSGNVVGLISAALLPAFPL